MHGQFLLGNESDAVVDAIECMVATATMSGLKLQHPVASNRIVRHVIIGAPNEIVMVPSCRLSLPSVSTNNTLLQKTTL